MILEHIQIFVRKTTLESRRCCNVNARSENRRRKHNVVTTFVFGCSDDVENNVVTTLLQRYPTSRPKYNQNLTLLKRRVPAGLLAFHVMLTFCFKLLQTPLITKGLIKHGDKFNSKVSHDRENPENCFSEFLSFMKCLKKYIMNISRQFIQ